MRQLVRCLSLCTLLLAAFPLGAQESKPAAPSCPSTANLDDLIKALDDAVSGPGNKDRACLRDVMLPDARLTPVGKTPDGAFAPHMLTVDAWIAAVARRGNDAFYERQVKVTTETYGHIAHLWSTYEIRPTPDGKATLRGINSIQAVNDGKRWRVLNIVWEPETTAGPVPEKYQP